MKYFYSWYSWFFVWVLLFFPKIPLIGLNGYAQGIRLEDFLSLVYVLVLFSQYGIALKIRFGMLWLIAGWLLLVGLFSSLRGLQVEYIIVVRVLEYIVFAYALLTCSKDRVRIATWLRWLIYLNVIVALMQYIGVFGAFASFEYLPAGHGWLSRPYGLLGGPWELGAVVAIAMLTIIEMDFNETRFSLLLLQLCVMLCLILAGTRGNLMAYLIAISFSYFYRNFKAKSIVLLPVFIAALVAFIFVLFNHDFLSLRMIAVLDVARNVIVGDLPFSSIISALGSVDQSFMIRLQWWDMFVSLWMENVYSVLFGAGWIGGLYMESLWVRVLVSFGVFGAFLFILLARRLSLAVFLFIVISGFTLDLFVSSKIFSVFCLYVFLIINKSDLVQRYQLGLKQECSIGMTLPEKA